jgi:hypothetical protein
MSKKRYINTRFWSDTFVVELNPLDRYLFLYLLTNEHTDICGVYELPWKVMSRETGLDDEMLKKMFARLVGKAYYIDGWVYIKNFARHQAVNPKIEEGIKRSIECVPEEIRSKIKQIDIDYHRLSKPLIDSELLILKPILKPKPKLIPKPLSASWSLAEKKKAMLDSEDKKMPIIAKYWDYKGISPENKEQYSSAIKRELRMARELTGYSIERIEKTMYALNGWEINGRPVPWTLETVLKYIDKDLTKLV